MNIKPAYSSVAALYNINKFAQPTALSSIHRESVIDMGTLIYGVAISYVLDLQQQNSLLPDFQKIVSPFLRECQPA